MARYWPIAVLIASGIAVAVWFWVFSGSEPVSSGQESHAGDPIGVAPAQNEPATPVPENAAEPFPDAAAAGPEPDRGPVPGMDADEAFETREQWLSRLRREKQARLDELLTSVFGDLPTNPVAELGRISEEQLVGMLRESGTANFPAAEEIGMLVGDSQQAGDWLCWFEQTGSANGIEAEVAATIFRWAVSKQAKDIREDPAVGRRALAVIDAQLEACRNKPATIGTLSSIWTSFKSLCPIQGGLALIRRWVVESPHGHEEMETALAECLQYWSSNVATPVCLELLSTRRGGAIKGLVSCWSASARRSPSSVWVADEVRTILEQPLADAVVRTQSSAAVLYAHVFASADLLKPRARVIAVELLARTDSTYCSAQGFSFLRDADAYTAAETWRFWFRSDDSYRVAAACVVAAEFPEGAGTPDSLQRLFDLAVAEGQPADVRGAAGLALCQLDSNNARCRQVLRNWLQQPEPESAMLVAAGRMVLWQRSPGLIEMLRAEISSASEESRPAHTTLFLLATVAPEQAIVLCEAKDSAAQFDDQSVLLVAATVEAVNPELWNRAAKLRRPRAELEPGWVARIRQKMLVPSPRAEERVVAYARVVPE